MYVLVVVDMQHEFIAARSSKVQEACKKAIARAIKQKAHIVFVEYDDYGDTLPKLVKPTRAYKNVSFVSKSEWDGSSQVVNILRNKSIPYTKFKVCGVYTECCVAATAKGIADKVKNAKVEVIRSACWSTDMRDHKYGLGLMNGYKRKVRFAR